MRNKVIILALLALLLTLLGCGFDFSLGGKKATDTPFPLPSTATPTAAKPTEALPTPTKKATVQPTATKQAAKPTNTPQAKPTASGRGGEVSKPTISPQEKPATNLKITSHAGWVSEDGDISIVGEAVNNGSQAIDTVVVVQATIKDKNGEVIEGDFTAYLDRPIIQPGDKSSFWVLITKDQLGDANSEDLTDYELNLYTSEDASPDVELEVLDSSMSEESDGLYISGHVNNQTKKEFVAISVYTTIYDADGNVINVTVDNNEFDVPLKPGEQTEFNGYFNDHYQDADNYYVVVTGWTAEAWGTDTSSSLGNISGALGYPSEGIPALRIFAFATDNSGYYYTETDANDDSYMLEGLEPGDYYVVAYPADAEPGYQPGLAGGYTEAVPCGLDASCKDHTLAPVTVYPDETTTNIDLTDWYAPDGTFPEMPDYTG